MFNTGWKEIAAYLKCGVRTAQRWQLEYHLPIASVRTKRKGLVMAESEGLDDWIRNRPLLKSKPSLQASPLFHGITRQAVEFVRAEVNMAHRSAEPASMSKDEAAVARQTKAAQIPIVPSHVSTNSGHRVTGNFVRRSPNAWPPCAYKCISTGTPAFFSPM